MSVHELKTWPEYFAAVRSGEKGFEVRKHDRDFEVGDRLVLREWDPSTIDYTGEVEMRDVAYILPGGSFGVQVGYCVLGLKSVNNGLFSPSITRDTYQFQFSPRGVGRNSLPCGFCEGAADSAVRSDLAAFVSSRASATIIVAIFEAHGVAAKIDYRDYAPHYVQVKIGACEKHRYLLEALNRLTGDDRILTPLVLQELIAVTQAEFTNGTEG